MQINLDPTSEDQAYHFAYEDEPTLELLITKLTPPIDAQCTKEAMSRPPVVNGRFRRQLPTPEFDHGIYQRGVFMACVKGWRFTNGEGEPCPLVDERGQPIPYSEENKKAVALQHKGLLQFGFDIANALGDISAEKVREERAAFRRADQVPARVAEAEL